MSREPVKIADFKAQTDYATDEVDGPAERLQRYIIRARLREAPRVPLYFSEGEGIEI